MGGTRNYGIVTASYWGFTLTDGALRMLVLLHFHQLGYTPVELAFLFVLYELFGVVTNLVGGWIASRLGLRVTLLAGLALQVVALVMLALVDRSWSKALSVAYVMGTQALSGIAKDLTKMSAKSAIKVLVPGDAHTTLFRWVAILTGSKNALKGVGFFLGGFLLSVLEFRNALLAMAVGIFVALVASWLAVPRELGKAKSTSKFSQLLSKTPAINVIAAARFFLFGARDIWFVVGVPVFLSTRFAWSFTEVGAFLAAWVIGYGVIQATTPAILKLLGRREAPRGRSAAVLAFVLAAVVLAVGIGVRTGYRADALVLVGLGVFGVVFAINSAVHSYLILAYSDGDKVALDVGFYYMANAAGRLVGTVLSGVMYQAAGLVGCLVTSGGFALAAAVLALRLPPGHGVLLGDGVDGGR